SGARGSGSRSRSAWPACWGATSRPEAPPGGAAPSRSPSKWARSTASACSTARPPAPLGRRPPTSPCPCTGACCSPRTAWTPAGGPPVVSALAADAEVAGVLDGFVRRLPERLGAMERALGGRDLGTLADLAHQLKGAATSYGFPTITEAAAQLEAVAAARGEV